MTTARTRSAIAGVLIVMGLLLAACGGSSSSDGGSDTTDGGSSAAEIDRSGIVRTTYDLVAAQRGGVTFDPTQTKAPGDEGLYYLVYGRLLRPTQDGDLVPDLAESATVVDDDTIEVVLREGITWQDGQPFDAASVKAGLEYSLAGENKAAMNGQFFELQSVEVVDPRNVRLTIPGAAPSWYSFLGSWETSIVRPDGDFSQPIGAGPMKVTAVVPQQKLSLETWDGYWDADSILIGGVEFTHLESSAAATGISGIKAGQIDLTVSTIEQVESLSGNAKELLRPDPGRIAFFQVCKSDGPLADARLRKAVAKGIDREPISEAIFAGTSTPALGLWPEGHRFHDPDVTQEYDYDPDAVRALLAEAGKPDGFSFDAYVLPSASMPEVAQVVQAQLAELGIDMKINPAPNYVDDFLGVNKPGAGLVPAMTQNKMNQFVGDVLSNACDYDDPALNALFERMATVNATSDEAVEIWHEFDEIVAEDTLFIPVTFGSNIAAYNSDTLAEVALWPVGQIVVPDPRHTAVKAG